MKQNTKLIFKIDVNSIIHRNDDNDPTVVLNGPPANMVFRRILDIEMTIDDSILELTTMNDINAWFKTLYKATLDANHKTLQTIADELNWAIRNEYDTDGYYDCKNINVTIKIIYLNYGITCTYDN